jgi:hypothetical protein
MIRSEISMHKVPKGLLLSYKVQYLTFAAAV